MKYKNTVVNLKLFSSEKSSLCKNNNQALPHQKLLQLLQRKHCKMHFLITDSQDTQACFAVWCSVKPQTLLRASLGV